MTGRNSVMLACVYNCDDLSGIRFAHSRLTSDEARRIASGIAWLSEFMMQQKTFSSRGGEDFRWEKSRPHHLAPADLYGCRILASATLHHRLSMADVELPATHYG